MTPEEIKQTIASIPTRTDEELVNAWKNITVQKDNKSRELYKPIIQAIEAHRKKTNKSIILLEPEVRKELNKTNEENNQQSE